MTMRMYSAKNTKEMISLRHWPHELYQRSYNIYLYNMESIHTLHCYSILYLYAWSGLCTANNFLVACQLPCLGSGSLFSVAVDCGSIWVPSAVIGGWSGCLVTCSFDWLCQILLNFKISTRTEAPHIVTPKPTSVASSTARTACMWICMIRKKQNQPSQITKYSTKVSITGLVNFYQFNSYQRVEKMSRQNHQPKLNGCINPNVFFPDCTKNFLLNSQKKEFIRG